MAMCISKVKLLSIVIVIFIALTISLPAVSLSSAADESVRVQTLRQTGKQLLEVGYEQYKRGMYDAAKITLDRAATYKNYLSVSDASKLDELLNRLGSQPDPEPQVQVSRPVETQTSQDVTAILRQARSFSALGRYDQAKEKFIQAKETGLLTAQQLAIVNNELAIIERAQKIQTEPVIISEPIIISEPAPIQSQNNGVDSEYIEFVPVDTYDIQPAPQSPVTMPYEVHEEFITPAGEEIQPELIIPVSPVPQTDTSIYSMPVESQPATGSMQSAKEDYIEVVKQKQRIQQSYTKAIVNEAVAKAKEYIGKEDFIKAKDEISRAASVVEKNKLLLGDEDYTQYTTTLQQLSTEINSQQTVVEQLKAETAKAEAKASQENLRAQQTADRQKRIQDLMTHAMEYQEQQRYQEALAQIETLLVIDPLNREAKRNKRMLEDIINLRRQVEVKREIATEEEDLFHDTQRSMIPHANLLNYPRNWQDIAAKRKSETITGLSAADQAIYTQLDTLVDLSALTPDTPMEEAIEIVRSSVDPMLKLVVRWRDLEENAYVERDTPISMQGLSGIPLGKGLKELLDSVSGGIARIDYIVEDGIVTVATQESLPGKMVTQVYDITELIGTPSNYRAELETAEDGVQAGEIITAEEAEQDRIENADAIILLIQETVSPMSWLINGGEGTISNHKNRLVVSQTPQIHELVQKLLKDLRKSLGQQVSIESRFLFVTENFLEDIGIDMQMQINSLGKFSTIQLQQGSYQLTRPELSLVPGSLATDSAPSPTITPGISLVNGVQYGSVLDNLSLAFFLRATQAHRDAKMLTAPRVTVLSGESAYIRVTKEVSFVSDYDFEDITGSGDNQPIRVIADPQTESETSGVVLNVTPTISDDKKYVLLEISTNYTKVNLDEFPVYSQAGDSFPISLPTREMAEVQTRVSIPDGGTLLVGGQKLGSEINKEAGVPGLSKVPVIGRLFSNRSKTKDQDILLVLVKPTIILQEEAEREYFAPLE